jgi:hypothetical protein
MSRDQEPFEDGERSWENVQGGHSGIPPDNMDNEVVQGASSDDDIIELVDVVREGDPIPDADGDDLSLLLDREEVLEKDEDFLARKDEDLNDFSLPLDETAEERAESDLTEPDGPHDRFESPDFDFEAPEGLEEPAGDEMSDISGEDLDLVMAGLVNEAEDETSKPMIREEEPPSVSQERLEAVITNTVTEVVERVVRETVAEVAERVIKQAIESLRQSLETKPE